MFANSILVGRKNPKVLPWSLLIKIRKASEFAKYYQSLVWLPFTWRFLPGARSSLFKENFVVKKIDGKCFKIDWITSSNFWWESDEEKTPCKDKLFSFMKSELFSWSSVKSLISCALSIACTKRVRQNAQTIKMICFILL